MKKFIKRIPWIGKIAEHFYRRILKEPAPFKNSTDYWEKRYKNGGNSGEGSYNELAEFKADVINEFISRNQIETVLDFGCGDGNQLTLLNIPKYTGIDVSETIIANCKVKFKLDPSKDFLTLKSFDNEKGDLVMSLDVIYHLVEDEIFEHHLNLLFSSSLKYVIVYSTNSDSYKPGLKSKHVRHRAFTNWVSEHYPNFELIEEIQNLHKDDGSDKLSSDAIFHIFKKKNA